MSEVINKHSRMPRKQVMDIARKPQEALSKLPDGGYGKLVRADPKTILIRYLSDQSTAEIAKDYGCTRQALGQFLLKNAEEEWKEAQVARAIARKEKAEDDMETANDPLSLASARERLKSAQWDLERVCRRIYGQDQPQLHLHVHDLGDRLRRARERTIEHDTQTAA